jgi:hypothetical protein
MELKRAGSQPSAKWPAEWFTGVEWLEPLSDEQYSGGRR